MLPLRTMSTDYKVSVIIPCFNHGEFLPEAVASVIGPKRDDTELIVVDDGSTDERTRREMDNVEAQGITVIRQENKGLAAARNAGIAASTGEYIIPLDADNRLRAGYIEHGIRVLDAKPKIGVVYGDAQCIGMRTDRWRIGAYEEARLLTWNYVDACAVFRRVIWEQNGGYDGSMPIQGFEDWDFWVGAVEHGWRFAYVPEILFEYRVGADSMITRIDGYEGQIDEFVARKHCVLYKREFAKAAKSLSEERRSLKMGIRNLGKELRGRVTRKLGNSAAVAELQDASNADR